MRSRLRLLLPSLWISAAASAHEPSLSRFNFREHARPIFARHCGGCHRAGGVAPMSLLEYQEAVPWANAIQLALLENRMPPFLPGEEGPPVRGARGLTAAELDTLVDWAVGATPEGESSSPQGSSPSTSPPSPDLLIRPREDVVLEESASEKTVCVALPAALERPSLIGAVEVLPGAPSLLRRATLFVGESCSEGEPLATWLPDQGRVSFPAGVGRELASASNLAVELHYVKGWGQEGKRLTDRTSVGLWFLPKGAKVRSVPIEGSSLPIRAAARLIALYPSMGDETPLRVEAVEPGGARRLLLSIERFDPAWKEKYFFEEPILLPGGTDLHSSHTGVWADLASAR